MDAVVNIQNTSSHYMNIHNKKPYTMNKDPYSIYDDDSSATHYFLVPPIKDPQKFTRAFQELNNIGDKNKPSICRPTTATSSGYINERNLRRSQSQRTRSRSCSNNENRSTRTTRHELRLNSRIPPPPPKRLEMDRDEDDYCTIKGDTKNEFIPNTNRPCILSSANTRIKKQHYFPQHEHSSTTNTEFSPILKKHEDIECCKTKNDKSDRYVDMCTCMMCVRSVSYKCSGADLEKEKLSEPCSCNKSGSSKSVGRYVCMGLMAVFLPCMLCYLPAKSCSRGRKSKHKHYTDDTYVYYQTNNNKPL